MTSLAAVRSRLRSIVERVSADDDVECPVDDPHGDYRIDDASLCEGLDDDLREDIARLGNARGQTSAGVVMSAVSQLRDSYEGRIIEFAHAQHAREYYRRHREDELEFEGALEELTPPGYYDQPAQPVKTVMDRMRSEHREKANAAARYLDEHDPDTRVVTNEYGGPQGIPGIDDELEIQHGAADEEAEA